MATGPILCPLAEAATRYDYADGREGIDETMSIDACLHSLFGVSKLAADVMCQEFGRYFQMPVGVFRAGCMTGPQHAAVELHGYLAYLVDCAVSGREYTIYGYKGKQVRDQIHCDDVARLFVEFFKAPSCGEVYNLGGGRKTAPRSWKPSAAGENWDFLSVTGTIRRNAWETTFATLPI